MAGPADSSVAKPSPGWSRRLPTDERLFLWLIAVSVTAMTAFTIAWVAGLGSQNVPDNTYRTTPAAFQQQVADFTKQYLGDDGKVHVPPGVDAYLMAQRYGFTPQLVLKAGHTYRIWVSSYDVLHGFSLVGAHQNLNLEVVPEHVAAVKLTPEKPGTYLIVCNEYCGLQHHLMRGQIIVEE